LEPTYDPESRDGSAESGSDFLTDFRSVAIVDHHLENDSIKIVKMMTLHLQVAYLNKIEPVFMNAS
jgi:hypothetical protein